MIVQVVLAGLLNTPACHFSVYTTRRNLERLALFDSFDAAVAQVAEYPSRMITPCMEMRDGVPWLLIPADAGYPVQGEILETAARG